MKLMKNVILLGLLFFLASCSAFNGKGQPPSVSSPDSGKSSITGRVFSAQTGKPLQQVTMELGSVVRQNGEAAVVLDIAHAPFTISDNYGYFVFNNVVPSEYVLVVGNVELGDYKIVKNLDSEDKTWVAEADKIIKIKDQQVDIAQPPLPENTK